MCCTRHLLPVLAAALSAAATLAQTQYSVVPATYTTNDAVSYLWLAGASRDVRQQTLVGQSHLTGLLGRTLRAIELRRTAANETYAGGVASLTVSLSTSPSVPLACSQTHAANVGTDVVQVFTGQVALPTSPPAVGPTMAWTPANTIRIHFTNPFVYTGGTLCVDITGHPVAGQNANWWMADAEFEDIAGCAVEIGPGCGSFGGANGRWSFVATRTVLPGAHARFWAEGPANGIGFAAFGAPSPVPIPLPWLGLPSPGCNLHLASLDALMVAVFEPINHPAFAGRGTAQVSILIPNNAAVFGTTLATQWLDSSTLAASNAIQWRVACAVPTFDMAAIEGHPAETKGQVAVHHAHVLRFEHQ